MNDKRLADASADELRAALANYTNTATPVPQPVNTGPRPDAILSGPASPARDKALDRWSASIYSRPNTTWTDTDKADIRAQIVNVLARGF
jgi:hypothetical protein